MKRDVRRRLIRAVNNINNVYLTKPEAINLFTIYGGDKETAEKIYGMMECEWVSYLQSNGLINPGTKGVPHSIAEKYLTQYGITEKQLRKNLETLEKETETTRK